MNDCKVVCFQRVMGLASPFIGDVVKETKYYLWLKTPIGEVLVNKGACSEDLKLATKGFVRR